MRPHILNRFVHRPQTIWLRKALFQIHLWVGLFVALYIFFIGITGSILVFRKEIEASTRPAALRSQWKGPARIDLPAALASIEKAFPGKKVSFIYAPKPDVPAFVGLLPDKRGVRMVAVDPNDGAVIGSESSDQHPFMRLVGQFHYFLLLPRSPGLMLNGIGAALLLVLTLSGLVIWWPGIKAWKRGFVVNFSKGWKRINYDSHSVIGFWTLAIVSFWAISGLYFAWPQHFTAVITRFSPLSDPAKRFAVKQAKKETRRADLSAILAEAASRSPGGCSRPPAWRLLPRRPCLFTCREPLRAAFSKQIICISIPIPASISARGSAG